MTQNARIAAPSRLALLALTALLLAGCDPAEDASGVKTGTSATESAGSASVQAPSPAETGEKSAPAEAGTVAQRQALQAAQSYLEFSGMSRTGLIRQLTSKAGDGFSTADATWAVDHVKVDWNAEAVEAAKSYMEMGGFSHAILI